MEKSPTNATIYTRTCKRLHNGLRTALLAVTALLVLANVAAHVAAVPAHIMLIIATPLHHAMMLALLALALYAALRFAAYVCVRGAGS